jgi:hypothetical protein
MVRRWSLSQASPLVVPRSVFVHCCRSSEFNSSRGIVVLPNCHPGTGIRSLWIRRGRESEIRATLPWLNILASVNRLREQPYETGKSLKTNAENIQRGWNQLG